VPLYTVLKWLENREVGHGQTLRKSAEEFWIYLFVSCITFGLKLNIETLSVPQSSLQI
jgi:hypothetical protein